MVPAGPKASGLTRAYRRGQMPDIPGPYDFRPVIQDLWPMRTTPDC